MRGLLFEDQARRAARKMVYLEQDAQQAAASGDMARASKSWQLRDCIREERSRVVRELWRLRRARYEAPD
jgi:hypothetical protein